MGERNADPAKIPYPKPGEKISLRKFAALVGVDYVSAREALENGRIMFEPGTRLLDFHTMKQAFQDSNAKQIAGLTPLGKAKLRKEQAVAEQKEIELAALKDKYLEKTAVSEAMFKWARTTRDALQSLPDRIASELASRVSALYAGAIKKALDKTEAEKLLRKITALDVERVVHGAWADETAKMLAELSKPPRIKNERG